MTCPLWSTSKNFADTGYSLKDLLGVKDDWDGWRESQGNPYSQYDLMMMMMMIRNDKILTFWI